MRIRRYMQSKLAFAFIVVALALFALSIRIVWIVANKGDDYSKIVYSQQNYQSTTIPFRRGTITDRNQTVLAASEQVYNIILDPSVIETEEDAAATIQALVSVFGYDQADLKSKLTVDSTASYIRYDKQLPKDKKTAFEEYEAAYNDDKNSVGTVKGVWFESEYKRVYPYNNLACTALGFSGTDSSKGNFGIEQYYNEYLIGTNGRSYGYLSTDGTVEHTTKDAVDGNTVITTLDYTIQKTVEDILDEFREMYTAENVGVLVMDPDNAEILAMATDSTFDLNQPADLTAYFTDAEIASMSSEQKSEFLKKQWSNYLVNSAFEPGSTAKAFTAAAALEEDLASPEDPYICDGGQQLSKDRYVRCAHNHGDLNFEEALAYSCNDVMMQLGSKMGKSIFCRYQEMFGFGKLTGVDLPSENSGMLYAEEKMSVVDLGTNTFGQNFTVTMMQMAAAYASVLNGGNYYQPHIVKQIVSPEGDVIKEVGTTVVRETVSEATAQVIRESLQMCVEGESDFATGKRAKISGYTVGGKTGTAEKIPRGDDNYILSFIGFAPAEDPQVIVYVVVDQPVDSLGQKVTSAGIAVKLEQMIMKAIVSYLNIPSTGEQFQELTNDLFEPPVPTDAEGNIIETIQETDENGDPVISTSQAGENPEDEGQAYQESDDPSESGEESLAADDQPTETLPVETSPAYDSQEEQQE